MSSIKLFIFVYILFGSLLTKIFAQSESTLTNKFGRISNIPQNNIHVSFTLTQDNCVRECVDFQKLYTEYDNQDCFAYNYEYYENTCELIHSTERINYVIHMQSGWITGLKI